jgi:hypothetical protein
MLNERRIPQSATASRRKNERGVILLLGTLTLPVLVSMMGLGIDASVVYSVKSKMQLAADGAALAAARALSVGLTLAAQETSARNNATNWFNKNFPTGDWGSSNTVLAQPQVFEDPNEPLVRHVVVTASSDAPSYFMRYWGRLGTRVGARSQASRRDSVIMMVLDRSGSMNTNNACNLMKAAAKQFTGMFSAERDRIGMLTYSDTFHLASAPVQTFKTVLGYTDPSGSGSGAIDQISCANWTSTPGATILGYNEIYKVGLPGALNVVLVFTDGVPNTMVIDARGYRDTARRGIFEDSKACQDSTLTPINSGASPLGHFGNNPPNWSTAINLGATNFFQYDSAQDRITGANLVAGPHGAIRDGVSWGKFWATSNANAYNHGDIDTKGCGGPRDDDSGNDFEDTFQWLPETDVFGNGLDNTSYRPLDRATFDGATRIRGSLDNWTDASFNASANAASRARTTRSLWDGRNFPGAFVYVIGLGDVDHPLLQRMANDPAAGPDGEYPAFPGYNTAQPVGAYVYAEDSTRLSSAFAQIASFILRLSQ